MAAQFGHQARPGAIPQPPANQLFDGRPIVDRFARGVRDLLALVAERFGQVRALRRPGPRRRSGPSTWARPQSPARRWPRRWPGPISSGRGRNSFDNFFLQLIVRLGARRQRLLPAIVAGQVAAMPLGADVVQVAEHAAPDGVHGVGVEDAVVPLVAGGQEQLGLAATRAISLHSWTLWPMSFSVMTCRPAFMAAMAAGACRCKGRAMITASSCRRRRWQSIPCNRRRP